MSVLLAACGGGSSSKEPSGSGLDIDKEVSDASCEFSETRS
jgi:hypothetical protein